MNKCETHNWLYEEFDETCPLCDAVKVEQDRIVNHLENLIETHWGCRGIYKGCVDCAHRRYVIGFIRGDLD